MICVSIAVTVSFDAAARELTFDQRVDAQEAIERVYYSHRIGTTRSFEEAAVDGSLHSPPIATEHPGSSCTGCRSGPKARTRPDRRVSESDAALPLTGQSAPRVLAPAKKRRKIPKS